METGMRMRGEVRPHLACGRRPARAVLWAAMVGEAGPAEAASGEFSCRERLERREAMVVLILAREAASLAAAWAASSSTASTAARVRDTSCSAVSTLEMGVKRGGNIKVKEIKQSKGGTSFFNQIMGGKWFKG